MAGDEHQPQQVIIYRLLVQDGVELRRSPNGRYRAGYTADSDPVAAGE
jgi:hypothetical protein